MNKHKLTETVKAAQAGEQSAFGLLYKEFAEKTYLYIKQKINNIEDIEDILQDVFIEVFQKISTLKKPESFSSWLHKIVRNKCNDAFRKGGNLISVDIDEVMETVIFEEKNPLLIPEKYLENTENMRIVREIIDNLPMRQNECIIYSCYHNLTNKEIAEILDIKVITVKKHLGSAKNKIRQEMKKFDKEHGTKLYGITLTSLFNTLYKEFEMPQVINDRVRTKVMATITENAAVTATTSVATTTAASIIKGAAIMTLKAKITIATVSTVIIAGITTGILVAVNHDNTTPASNQLGIAQESTTEHTTTIPTLVTTAEVTTTTPHENTTTAEITSETTTITEITTETTTPPTETTTMTTTTAVPATTTTTTEQIVTTKKTDMPTTTTTTTQATTVATTTPVATKATTPGVNPDPGPTPITSKQQYRESLIKSLNDSYPIDLDSNGEISDVMILPSLVLNYSTIYMSSNPENVESLFKRDVEVDDYIMNIIKDYVTGKELKHDPDGLDRGGSITTFYDPIIAFKLDGNDYESQQQMAKVIAEKYQSEWNRVFNGTNVLRQIGEPETLEYWNLLIGMGHVDNMYYFIGIVMDITYI